MRTPSSPELLDAWETAAGLGPSGRALALLVAASDESPSALAALPVGSLDRRLLSLCRQLFGSAMSALVDCPGCGTRLQVDLDVEALVGASGRPSDAEAVLTEQGWRVRFRLPDSRDLAVLEGLPDVAAARRILLDRCLLEVDRDGVAAAAAEVPEAVVGAVSRAMAELDPGACPEVPVDCPRCGTSWRSSLDPATFLWAAVDAWARRTVHEVHRLATAYSWTEADVLALTPRRRATYLELAGS